MTMRLWIRQLFTRSATRTLRKAPRCCRPMLETLEDRLTPAVFNVTAGSVTSLAAAITFANANPGTDVIVPSGTYNLATLTTPGQLTLSANVTISGTPGSTIIEANASANTAGYRVFEIGGGTNALIDGVTISNGAISGQQGGGIAVDANATLTVDNCTVSDNFAAVGSGIANAGTLMVDICTLSDNFGTVGGGIYNTGIATLDNSTLSRNTANLEGGGINNNGTATIDNCTISGNTIISPGFGGGIYNSAMLTIDDSTVSGNTGSVAGIDASSTVTLNNTIVADAVSGNFAAGSANNLLGPGAGGGLTSGTNGNTIEASVADLGLDPSGLGINGGPTETIALESGSPAIDKGNNALVPTGVATDQRGYERIVNGTVDIGAYEFNSINLANNLVVTTTADTYSDTNTPAAPISLPPGDRLWPVPRRRSDHHLRPQPHGQRAGDNRPVHRRRRHGRAQRLRHRHEYYHRRADWQQRRHAPKRRQPAYLLRQPHGQSDSGRSHLERRHGPGGQRRRQQWRRCSRPGGSRVQRGLAHARRLDAFG